MNAAFALLLWSSSISIAGIHGHWLSISAGTSNVEPTPLMPEGTKPADAGIYKDLDTNKDGGLGRDEIRKYITDEIGGISFDDKEEISRATSVAFKRLDSDRDGLIEPADLRHFWQTKNHGLRTVDEVCDWVEHAVQLPQYAGAFRKNAIVGSDFPWLLEQEGAMLRDDVGIVSELHRRQILRGIRMVVLSVGSVVNAPQGLLAESHADGLVLLQWATSLEDGIPAHRYELQRSNSSGGVWSTVYAGSAPSHSEIVPDSSVQYVYRVRAWNIVGHSHWSAPVAAVLGLFHQTVTVICTFVAITSTVGAFFKFVAGPLSTVVDRLNAPLVHQDGNTGSAIGEIHIVEAEAVLSDTSDRLWQGGVAADGPSSSNDGSRRMGRKSSQSAIIEEPSRVRKINTRMAMQNVQPPPETPEYPSSNSSPDEFHDLGSMHASTVKLHPVKTGTTPKDSVKRCEDCNRKFDRVTGPWRHQCRRCMACKCNQCTVVGCYGICGDLCICTLCHAEERKQKGIYKAKMDSNQTSS